MKVSACTREASLSFLVSADDIAARVSPALIDYASVAISSMLAFKSEREKRAAEESCHERN